MENSNKKYDFTNYFLLMRKAQAWPKWPKSRKISAIDHLNTASQLRTFSSFDNKIPMRNANCRKK
jgi:hypothetical protein